MHGYKFFNRHRSLVLRRQGRKCSVKDTAVEWARLDEGTKAKYQIEADKINAMIAATHGPNRLEIRNVKEEHDAHDSSDLDDESEESSLDSLKYSEPRQSSLSDYPELYDPKEFRKTRKAFDVKNMRQRVGSYAFFAKHMSRVLTRHGKTWTRKLC